jgi:hypothetical protein
MNSTAICFKHPAKRFGRFAGCFITQAHPIPDYHSHKHVEENLDALISLRHFRRVATYPNTQTRSFITTLAFHDRTNRTNPKQTKGD